VREVSTLTGAWTAAHPYNPIMLSTPHRIDLCALGSTVGLITDSALLCDALKTRLGSFLIDGSNAIRSATLRETLIEARFDPAPPRVSVGEEILELVPDNAIEQAVGIVFRALLDGVKDFLVLHAAALERKGRALLVAGPSGSGKTTLTLALIERGFRLLSDDFAPLERSSGRIHPFLKAAGIRPGAAADLAAATGSLPERSSNPSDGAIGAPRRLDPTQLDPKRLATQPCQIAAIVLIGDERVAATADAPYAFSLLCAGTTNPVRESLEGLPGLELIEARGAELIFMIDPKRVRAKRLDDLLDELAPLLLEYGVVASLEHDTSRTPRLEPLVVSETLFLLGREIQNRRPGGQLLASVGGDPTRLLAELGQALQTVHCVRLIPGEARASAALIARQLAP